MSTPKTQFFCFGWYPERQNNTISFSCHYTETGFQHGIKRLHKSYSYGGSSYSDPEIYEFTSRKEFEGWAENSNYQIDYKNKILTLKKKVEL